MYGQLHKSIVHLEWENVEEVLSTKKGVQMTKETFKEDLPLHMAVERRAPDQLIISILQANKKAALVRGKMGNLPLHTAAQNCLSPTVVTQLIKAHPEGLDVLNDSQCTPRDFHQRNDVSLEALMRPTACWIEDVEKEEYNKRVNDRTFELKNKIQKLREQLAMSKKKTAVATHLLGATRPRLSQQWASMKADKEREAKVEDLKQVLEQRLNGIKERITIMEENMKKEKSSEEVMINNVLKRSYMEEAQKKYEKVAATHEVIKRDLEQLKQLHPTENSDNSQGNAEIIDNQEFNCKHDDTMLGSVKNFFNSN